MNTERGRRKMAVELLGKSQTELREWMGSLGEPTYRGAQVYHALYAERQFEFAAMTNLPGALREQLSREAAITLPRVARKYDSADGSVRYLLPLGAETHEGGGAGRAATVEAVFMPSEGRQTI